MTDYFRRGLQGFLCAFLLASTANAQSQVQHKTHYYDLSQAGNQLSKSQTMDPEFDIGAPLGLPRNGEAFQIDYTIWFTADNGTENIDYFAFHAPVGWTITAIGGAPTQTACEDDPHTSVIAGFSDSTAYWGGDYGGAVVTPGDASTYPDINNRSGCGPFDTATDSASAHAAGLMHTFSVTMTPSAPGECPGSTTGALPLCCSEGEVSAGGPPPVGSEPYFNEMIGATDGNANPFGDGFYYVSLQCPMPVVDLVKFPLDATVEVSDCIAAFPSPDTLFIPSPPADAAQFCYVTSNISSVVFSDPWASTSCDSVLVSDDVLGDIFDGPQTLDPETLVTFVSDSTEAPPIDTCVENLAVARCTTPEGSDYVLGEGVLTEQRSSSVPGFFGQGWGIDEAWLCTESSLPVELSHFSVKADGHDLLLEWTTSSETGNAGFAVEHRLADEAVFREMGFVDGAGTSQSVHNYAFRITEPGPGRHAVRLKQVDIDGAASFSPQLLVEIEVPGEYYLTAAYPNPLTTSATVEFAVPASQDVTLELIDIQGRPVRTLFDGRLEANARRKAVVDASGLASGTYFLRMNGERFQTSEAVTVAK